MLVSIVSASMLIPANDNARENAQAPENSPVISETPAGEWELDRVDFIHYVKPDNPARTPRTPRITIPISTFIRIFPKPDAGAGGAATKGGEITEGFVTGIGPTGCAPGIGCTGCPIGEGTAP